MEPSPDFVRVEGRAALLRLQLALYSSDAILAAAHRFTGRCFVHVEEEPGGTMLVRLQSRGSLDNLETIAGEFANEALDQSLRIKLRMETEPIRRVLIAQAFSKANLLHPILDEANPLSDPLSIGRPDREP